MKKYTLIFLLLFVLFQISSARTNLPVTFTHDNLTVNARLTLPATSGPYQVIIIAPGSGANDKDATIPMYGTNTACLYPGLYGDTLRPYKGLSDALADSGYAVLTYDKLEYTYSSAIGTITFHKLWLPVMSAINYLKTRSDIDTSSIILLGHSEGSTLIPYIARQETGIKALISLAGPRHSPYDTLLAYQLNYIAHTCNGDTAMAQAQGAQLISYFNLIRSGNWNSSTPAFAGVPAAVWSDYIKVSDSVLINYTLAARPTLFIGLGNDINVPVSSELSQFQQELSIPADFYIVPGLNHYLTTPTNPATSEVLTDTIVYWLRRHVPALGLTGINGGVSSDIILTGTSGHWEVRAINQILQEVALYDMEGKCVYFKKTQGTDPVMITYEQAAGLYVLVAKGSRTMRTFKLQL